MKRIATTFSTLLLAAAWLVTSTMPAQAQSFSADWEFSTAEGNLPSYFRTNNDTRYLAYGRIDDGSGTRVERVLVASGGNDPYEIRILDASDGTDLGTLPSVTSLPTPSDGRKITDVEVTDDGIIIACNEVNNAFTADGTTENFKCYRWDSLTDSSPETVVDYTVPDNSASNGSSEGDWVGRQVTVVGSMSDNSATILTTAARESSYVYRFTTTDNGQSFTGEAVERKDRPPTGNINGVAPLGPGASPFIVNVLNVAPIQYDASGNEVAEDQGAFTAFTNSIKYFEAGGKQWAVTFRWDTTGENQFAELVDVSLGLDTSLPYATTANFGRANEQNNANGTGDVAVRVNNDDTATIFVLATNNGVGSYTTGSALPVELANFDARRSGDDVSLTWKTLSETNNQRFEIERAIDGGSFAKIGQRAGQGTTTEATPYSFVDASIPYGAETIDYRLRQVDVDGGESLSDVVTIRLSADRLQLLGSAPNPVKSTGEIRYTLPEQANVRVALYDVLGREVRVLDQGARAARQHSVSLDASGLSSGVYFIRLEAMGQTRTTRVSVV
ncbi:MAG: T9SS type A sorting domain-containing protein, partial [Bacteroidetes bacterium]|nr:T9SS type A sorting domain-containing protein [Bacteroidota bacterium]